jgi:archaellum component FlaG (FlaF/FlaG flagellin family)
MELLQVFLFLVAIVLTAIISGVVGYQTGKMAWRCRGGCHEEQERVIS